VGSSPRRPTDEAPKEGQLDPKYAAGKAAILIMIDTADTLQTDRGADRTAHTVTIHKPASRKSGPTDGPRNRQGH
jgi:hypothetical protein